MRLRFLIGILAFALAVLALLFWLRPTKSPVVSAAPVSAQQNVQLPAPQTNQQLVAISQPNTNPLATANPTAGASSNPIETREQQWKQAVEGHNHPVRFYGMVIDQDSNALAGVSVELSVRHGIYVIPNSEDAVKYAALSQDELQKVLRPSIRLVTDGDGRFQWDDARVTGDILSIANITKEGYELEPNTFRSFGVASGSYDNPATFKMWNTNIHEQLVIGEKKFSIVPDGRPYVIDLAKGTIAESGDGDLKVWVKRPAQVTLGQRYDWSCEVATINGGLLQETDSSSSMYSAPQASYVPSFQFEQKVGSGWGDTTGPRRFYVRLNNGQEYGRITIELYARYNNQTPGLIRLSYAINPSGSRILR